jgi:hypothetical protein
MADGVDEQKTYSAKQVATRIGTDAKQLRKFFRDPNSGYDAVGQGGRYDFPESDIPKIKTAFDVWNSTKTRRNRTSPQKKLATAAGLIPGQRTQSPGTDNPPTPRRQRPDQLLKQGLHGNALDNDTLTERHAGIGARVRRHGLMPNQQGRLVEMPEHIRRAREAQPQVLDFTEPTPAEVFAPVADPDDPEFELELEDDGDIEGTGDDIEELDFDTEDLL